MKNEYPFFHTESVAYEFGASRGLIQYQFPPGNQPDTEEDNIALGLMTLKTDAVLLRIESSNTQDYFELEVVSYLLTKNISFKIHYLFKTIILQNILFRIFKLLFRLSFHN